MYSYFRAEFRSLFFKTLAGMFLGCNSSSPWACLQSFPTRHIPVFQWWQMVVLQTPIVERSSFFPCAKLQSSLAQIPLCQYLHSDVFLKPRFGSAGSMVGKLSLLFTGIPELNVSFPGSILTLFPFT